MTYGTTSIGSSSYGGGVSQVDVSTADVAITLPIITISATALNHADAAIALPQFTLVAQAHSEVDGVITLPQLFATDFAGHLEVTASLSFPLLSAQGGSGATGNITFPLLNIAASSGLANTADVAITLPQFALSSTALLHATASLTLPQISLSATALQGEIGNLNVALVTLSTSFIIIGRAYKGTPPDCVVMNTKINAVSEYEDYAFNSYTRFNGVNLAANQNGIYELDETSQDEGTYVIKAHIKSGEIDTYNGTIQRLRNAYLSHESDGDLQMVTKADDTITRKYSLVKPQDSSGIIERRIKFEKGIKDRVFDFKIENVNGSSMDIESMRVMLEPIIGKKG